MDAIYIYKISFKKYKPISDGIRNSFNVTKTNIVISQCHCKYTGSTRKVLRSEECLHKFGSSFLS